MDNVDWLFWSANDGLLLFASTNDLLVGDGTNELRCELVAATDGQWLAKGLR